MATINRYIDFNDDLRIYPYIEEYSYEPNVSHVDFTTLGLTKDIPTFSRGVKTLATYSNQVPEVVVTKEFEDIPSGLRITIKWLKSDGTVGLEKIFDKPLSLVEKGDMLRKRRQRVISYLQFFAVGTPYESYIAALFNHYKNQVDAYIQTGSRTFHDDMDTETDPTILAILSAQGVDPAYPTDTVKDRIQYQIDPSINVSWVS